MKTSESHSLAERVNRLERENRRLKRIGVPILVGVVAVLLAGAEVGKPKIIEAEGFVLKDKEGRKRAELSSSPDGSSSMKLFDLAGTVRVRMAIEGAFDDIPMDAALISVCDDRGRDRIVTQVNPFGALQYDFCDQAGGSRLSIVADDVSNGVQLSMNDMKDARRFSLLCGEDGSVGMHFEDRGPNARLSLYANNDGNAGITTSDVNENDRFVLECDRDGLTSLKVLDEKGRPKFQAPNP